MKGVVFDIQHYAVHDGPGIRTLVFLKGCPLRCAWCCNPESHHHLPQLRYHQQRCTGCLDCTRNCSWQNLQHIDGAIKREFSICLACAEKPCIHHCNYGALAETGKMMTATEVVNIVSRDMAFYRNSGGGVTFSGGEPMAQPAFLLEMLRQCRQRTIHTTVETCGWASAEALHSILPYADLFIFDLKIIDEKKHEDFTGKSVQPILENLALLASSSVNLTVRVPLIDGITDTPGNLQAIAGLMKELGLQRVKPVPSHTLGMAKYEEFGLKSPMPGLTDYDRHRHYEAGEYFTREGFVLETAW